VGFESFIFNYLRMTDKRENIYVTIVYKFLFNISVKKSAIHSYWSYTPAGFSYVLKLHFIGNLAEGPATPRLFRKGVLNMAFGKIGKQDAFMIEKPPQKSIGGERNIIHKKIHLCATAICRH
jgi:hypothetical protein